jgi:hypothetical protein
VRQPSFATVIRDIVNSPIGDHRPQLVEAKRPTVDSDSVLGEEDRATHGHENRERSDEDDWAENGQEDQTE